MQDRKSVDYFWKSKDVQYLMQHHHPGPTRYLLSVYHLH